MLELVRQRCRSLREKRFDVEVAVCAQPLYFRLDSQVLADKLLGVVGIA